MDGCGPAPTPRLLLFRVNTGLMKLAGMFIAGCSLRRAVTVRSDSVIVRTLSRRKVIAVYFAALLAFAAILFVAAASPGPGIAAIVARVLGRGTEGALAFTAGLAVGDVVWLTCAVFGLAAVAQSFHGVFVALKFAGAAYLLWFAWKLWTAPVVTREITAAQTRERPAKLFLAGLALTLGDPKVVVFYLALLPTVLDLARVTALGYAELGGSRSACWLWCSPDSSSWPRGRAGCSRARARCASSTASPA